MSEYNLDFYEALKIVIDGGAVKCESSGDGIFLRLNQTGGQLMVVDAGNLYRETEYPYLKGLSTQTFRELTILTMKELSK